MSLDPQLPLALCWSILILTIVTIIWQVIAVMALTAGLALAQASEGEGHPPSVRERLKSMDWEPLKVGQSHFPRNLGMLDAERDDYAGNLAGVAVTQLLEKKASDEAIALARQMIGLALHLSPRNRKALVVNIQLGRGAALRAPEADYGPQSMARLLMKRAEMLKKQKGDANIELAGYMLDLAVSLNPDNEDAIFMSELHRLDHGDVDWSPLTRNKE